MSSKSFTGINIQYPISTEILSGRKTIETRTYPIPKKYIGKTMLFVETAGPKRKFKSRIVAKITFSECFPYQSKREFYADVDRHLVTANSPWAWNDEKPKWGWVIADLVKMKVPKQVRKRLGIIYTKGLFAR
jgi:hypothetical protein